MPHMLSLITKFLICGASIKDLSQITEHHFTLGGSFFCSWPSSLCTSLPLCLFYGHYRLNCDSVQTVSNYSVVQSLHPCHRRDLIMTVERILSPCVALPQTLGIYKDSHLFFIPFVHFTLEIIFLGKMSQGFCPLVFVSFSTFPSLQHVSCQPQSLSMTWTLPWFISPTYRYIHT